MSATPIPMLRAISGGRGRERTPLELQRAFHLGDQGAFEQLARPHLDTLFTLCLRLTKNRAEAEDLAQETLVKVMRLHSRYDPSRSFRPWLLKIAVNMCRDRMRTVWWKRVLPFASPQGDTRPSPEANASGHHNDRLVRHALGELPPKYREALALFHLQDLQYKEMAEITGVAIPALKQRVRRGSEMLRKKVTELYPELVPARIHPQ